MTSRKFQLQQWRKEHGVCQQCGRRPPTETSWSCQPCLDYQRALYRHHRYGEPKPVRSAILAGNLTSKPRRQAKKVKRIQSHKAYHRSFREQMFEHYGEMCSVCGEPDHDVLEFHHVEGGGRIDRAKNGYGSHFYKRMAEQGFPEGLRVLCANCHKREHARLRRAA